MKRVIFIGLALACSVAFPETESEKSDAYKAGEAIGKVIASPFTLVGAILGGGRNNTSDGATKGSASSSSSQVEDYSWLDGVEPKIVAGIPFGMRMPLIQEFCEVDKAQKCIVVKGSKFWDLCRMHCGQVIDPNAIESAQGRENAKFLMNGYDSKLDASEIRVLADSGELIWIHYDEVKYSYHDDDVAGWLSYHMPETFKCVSEPKYGRGKSVYSNEHEVRCQMAATLGRDLFVPNGEFTIGGGRWYVKFETKEYSTRDKLFYVTSFLFVGSGIKRVDEDYNTYCQKIEARKNLVKSFCGLPFGAVVKDSVRVYDNSYCYASLDRPISLEEETIKSAKVYVTPRTRRIYGVQLKVKSGVTDIIEMLKKKYPWDESKSINTAFKGVELRLGNVYVYKDVDRGIVAMYNKEYESLAEREAAAIKKAAAEEKERRKNNEARYL